jgi:hypothetical protein
MKNIYKTKYFIRSRNKRNPSIYLSLFTLASQAPRSTAMLLHALSAGHHATSAAFSSHVSRHSSHMGTSAAQEELFYFYIFSWFNKNKCWIKKFSKVVFNRRLRWWLDPTATVNSGWGATVPNICCYSNRTREYYSQSSHRNFSGWTRMQINVIWKLSFVEICNFVVWTFYLFEVNFVDIDESYNFHMKLCQTIVIFWKEVVLAAVWNCGRKSGTATLPLGWNCYSSKCLLNSGWRVLLRQHFWPPTQN